MTSQLSTLSKSSSSKLQIPNKFRRIFEPSRYKAFFGGRGSAKSHTISAVLLLMSSQQKLRILCAREIQKSLKSSSKQLIIDKINSLGLSQFYKITDSDIKGKNGSRFLFEGIRTNPESIKSMEGIDIVWVEEASTVSQSSIDLLIPTIRKPGSEIWFSWNPRFTNDPVDKLFLGSDGPPPNTILFKVNFSDNPWFPEVLRAEMEWDKKRDPDKYAHVWLGHYVMRSELSVFRNWSIDEPEVPPNCYPSFGADWGFSVDPSVLVKCYIFGRTLYIAEEAYQVGCEIDHLPKLFNKVYESNRYEIRADSARPETISYMNRNGFNIAPSIKGAGSVVEGIEFMKSFDIKINPSCRHAIDEFSTFCYKKDKRTDEILPELEESNNHVIDATRYAVENQRRNNSSSPRIRRYG